MWNERGKKTLPFLRVEWIFSHRKHIRQEPFYSTHFSNKSLQYFHHYIHWFVWTQNVYILTSIGFILCLEWSGFLLLLYTGNVSAIFASRWRDQFLYNNNTSDWSRSLMQNDIPVLQSCIILVSVCSICKMSEIYFCVRSRYPAVRWVNQFPVGNQSVMGFNPVYHIQGKRSQ